MYYNVIFYYIIIILRFPASFVFKSSYDIVTQLLCTFVLLCVGFGRFWCGNDKYDVIHVTSSCNVFMYVSDTFINCQLVLYILYKY